MLHHVGSPRSRGFTDIAVDVMQPYAFVSAPGDRAERSYGSLRDSSNS
jgi:hypothetical protein